MSLPPVEELLAHRGRSILIDRVLECGDRRIRCAVEIAAHHPYERDGAVPAIVLLEMMAQAVAAYVGLSRRDEGVPPQMGYVVAARGLELHVDSVGPGEELEVEACLGFGKGRVATFVCSVTKSTSLLAATTLTVYQPGEADLGPAAGG